MISFKDYIVFVLENKKNYNEYKEKEEVKFFHKKKNAIKYKQEKKLYDYQVAERILIDYNLFGLYDFEEALTRYADTNVLPLIVEVEDER
jgi:hypothetical protein